MSETHQSVTSLDGDQAFTIYKLSHEDPPFSYYGYTKRSVEEFREFGDAWAKNNPSSYRNKMIIKFGMDKMDIVEVERASSVAEAKQIIERLRLPKKTFKVEQPSVPSVSEDQTFVDITEPKQDYEELRNKLEVTWDLCADFTERFNALEERMGRIEQTLDRVLDQVSESVSV